MISMVIGGETGIRTLGTLTGSTVFETAPFDHSGTSPRRGSSEGPFSLARNRLQVGFQVLGQVLRFQLLAADTAERGKDFSLMRASLMQWTAWHP